MESGFRHSPQGECGLKYTALESAFAQEFGHSPQGECGLKSIRRYNTYDHGLSLPARGVWIEIWSVGHPADQDGSLPARGVWIEMIRHACQLAQADGHSPQGECGLKFRVGFVYLRRSVSLPARGVWIEMLQVHRPGPRPDSHSPQGECGLKSPSLVGAKEEFQVTPRKGSVD